MTAKGKEDQEKRDHYLAFVSDPETESVVKAVVSELLLPYATVLRGNVRSAVDYLLKKRSPKLLIVDLSGSDLPVSDINMLAEVCEPGVSVLAIGERNDVGLFRDLMNVGVTDYLVKPINRDLLARTLSGAAERADVAATGPRTQGGRTGRLIAVMGARGGVGSTTFAVNAAWALANEKSRRVALLDLDLQTGTVSLMLDLKPSHGLRDALENPARLDSLFVERVMARHGERLFVLSSEEPLTDDILYKTEGVERLLGILRNQFHYVVVDVPRSDPAVARFVLSQSSVAVIVTELTLAAVRDTARLVGLINQDSPSHRVIVVGNRTGAYRKGELAQSEFEKALGRRIDAIVPFDPVGALEAANVGEPVAARSGTLADGTRKIAAELGGAGLSAGDARRGGWLSKVLGR
ncbi:AAA family ATPase [Zavarzinia sp. CC-PAN008]|uniref:AAA family ATPase n=1 Tax=Zavarzinia sp. CC-PAN008 TaxID=3243332 RepID=UPI003F7487D8